jgi:hypothetical protein
MVSEVAERDLDPHTVRTQPSRVAHQAAHRGPSVDQRPQQRPPDGSGGTGQQQHRRERTRRSPGVSLKCVFPAAMPAALALATE